jgi:hypothetical protein
MHFFNTVELELKPGVQRQDDDSFNLVGVANELLSGSAALLSIKQTDFLHTK